MPAVNQNLVIGQRKQRTLKKSVEFSGIGVHTGQTVTLRFCPAKEGTGVVFKRIDLPDQPLIPAAVHSVCDTARSTSIGMGNVRVHTIEHVMSAVRVFELDNLCIEVSNMEPPIANGGADIFVKMIEDAGIVEQQGYVPLLSLKEPIYWSEGFIHLVALPYDGYRISYTLNYPNSNVMRAQYCSILVNQANFCSELAPCRTFSLYEEIAPLIERGLIKGGSLDNAVVIHGDAVLSKGGLHFSDEMVRHKVLDMIGDLSLIGLYFHAHIIAVRAGHASNHQLAKKLYNYFMEVTNV